MKAVGTLGSPLKARVKSQYVFVGASVFAGVFLVARDLPTQAENHN